MKRDEESRARLADALRELGADLNSDPHWQERVWAAISGGRWEHVETTHLSGVRRYPVPGGWLYQVELATFLESAGGRSSYRSGWHAPVFVPDPEAGR